MVGKRKKASTLPPRMYSYKGKRITTYYTITSENLRVNLGHDLQVAKRKQLELEEGRSIAGTIGELLDDYLHEIQGRVTQGTRSPRTLKDNEIEIRHLKTAFGKMTPNHLLPKHVWAYLHRYRGVVAPVRANREISLLQAAFSWARDQGLVNDNPCLRVRRNEEQPRTRLVSDAELEAFVSACQDSEAGVRIALAAQLS